MPQLPLSPDARCPCGSGETYGACCARVHADPASAPTAEALMRSRFSAFALDLPAHLLATWHPRTRPAALETDPGLRWQRLDVLETSGGPFDDVARVRFAAYYRSVPGTPAEERVHGVQEEDSRFLRENGRWYYLDDAGAAA